MSSKRRIISSRANGAKSHGPSTPEGKLRSSQNAFRHGLLADCVVLNCESREAFLHLLQVHEDRFQPADGVEFGMIEEMVAAKWRIHRAWAMEKGLLEKEINLKLPGGSIPQVAAAVEYLAGAPALGLVHRYETRLHNMYQRSLRTFDMLHEDELPNEPNPITEQPAPAPQRPQPTESKPPSGAANPGCSRLSGGSLKPVTASPQPTNPPAADPAPPPSQKDPGGAV
jgi:hypothetical protein